MKKSRFSEGQIFQILKEAESGVPVPELCRKLSMSSASFYQWRSNIRRDGSVEYGAYYREFGH